MRITEIRAYRVELPLHEGAYKWSGGNAVQVFDSTIVEILTDSGITGYGEVCPLGPAYLPAYAAGARTGIAELAPSLIGADPTQLGPLNEQMDRAMRGHPYVKSAIDMACWDILGKACGQSVTNLLGGSYSEDFPLYRAISQDSPETNGGERGEISRRGLSQISVKGRRRSGYGRGADPPARPQSSSRGDVLIADANTGWTQHEALRVASAVRNMDVYIEQPCKTYEECLAVRRHTNRPFILDEVIDNLAMVARGYADQAMDVINLKISKVGGLTRARADPRFVRFARHRTHDRGHLGRRHHHRRHRASGAKHTARNAFHHDRLQ